MFDLAKAAPAALRAFDKIVAADLSAEPVGDRRFAAELLDVQQLIVKPVLRAQTLREYFEIRSAILSGHGPQGDVLARFLPTPKRYSDGARRAIALEYLDNLRTLDRQLSNWGHLSAQAKTDFREGLHSERRTANSLLDSAPEPSAFSAEDQFVYRIESAAWLWSSPVMTGSRPASDEVADDLALTFRNASQAWAMVCERLLKGVPHDQADIDDLVEAEEMRAARALRPGDFEPGITLDQMMKQIEP